MIEGWQVFLSRLHNNYQLFGAAFSSTNTSWELVRKAGDTRDGSNQGCFKPFYTPSISQLLLIVTVLKFTFNLNALSARMQATVIKRITIKELQCIEMNQKNKKFPAPKI